MRKSAAVALSAIIILFSLAAPIFASEIHLAAAASLKDVLDELTASFSASHRGVVFVKNYGASGTLAKQIENGVPADVFISAHPEWAEYLRKKNLVDERSSGILAFNQLVFVGRPELRVACMVDVARLQKIAIGSPAGVPAGAYAMAAMKRSGIATQMAKKLVMAKDVRECLLYAERGEVDGAFVYKTDALQAAKTAKILFVVPEELHSRIAYPLAFTV